MSELSLAFLGTPEVYHDGQMLTFRTRKTLAQFIDNEMNENDRGTPFLAVASWRQKRVVSEA